MVAELAGKIYSFTSQSAQPELMLSFTNEIPNFGSTYGFTFHPKFAENHFIYVCYVLNREQPDGTRLSRFEVIPSDPPRIDPKSEQLILTWLSGGHNGGCLKFGRDGFLYISTGDATAPSPPDALDTGQDISDLLSSVLRIDVDHSEAERNYRVPPDNPFVHLAGARPEIWAYGFRNPWKMSFDRQTGELWVGDVGWELWELIYKVERGGNYGWSAVEGPQSVKPNGKRGPTPILPPMKVHPHSEAASITGGFVYRGKRLPELQGAYIYGDWVTGKIWGLRQENGKATWSRELATPNVQIVSFAESSDGELVVMDYGGQIHELELNPAESSQTFPRKLSETGLFESAPDQIPAAGVYHYSINANPWADGALADHFVALPGFSETGLTNGNWVFPTNTVFVRTFYFGTALEELPEVRKFPRKKIRRAETQLLLFDGVNWNAYAYQWNDAQTDATLVPTAGTNEIIVTREQPLRKQTWRHASRAECLRCHNSWCGYVLGFNFSQLQRDHMYLEAKREGSNPMGHRTSQVAVLAQLKLTPPVDKLPAKLVDPYEGSGGLNLRARSYLHVNCSPCHRENAGGAVLAQMIYDLPLEKMHLINDRPTQGTFDLPEARVIAPGEPLRSVLFYRMSSASLGRMPRIGSAVVDARGLRLIHDWIRSLPASDGGSQATVTLLATIRETAKGAWGLSHMPNGTQPRAISELMKSSVGALALAIDSHQLGHLHSGTQRQVEETIASAPPTVQALLEAFLPEEKRMKRLGTEVDPNAILSRKGDAERGRKIFFAENGIQCARCHRLGGEGAQIGPDLSQIGQKYSRELILEQILFPSKRIDPEFVTYQVETANELSYSGFILRKTDAETLLKDGNGQEVRVPLKEIKLIKAQTVSLMPEQLLQGLTAQEAADLIDFLAAQKP